MQVPKLDLGFAISADSSRKNETFKIMKDTIKAIMDTHVTSEIHYSIIIFGTTANTVVSFANKPPTTEILKEILTRASRESGPPNLKNVLEKSKEVFEGSGLRPNATKTLIIITDKKSSSDANELPGLVKQMEDKKVRIISVAIGNEVDTNELEKVSTSNDDVIKTDIAVNPKTLAKQILDRAKKGKI